MNKNKYLAKIATWEDYRGEGETGPFTMSEVKKIAPANRLDVDIVHAGEGSHQAKRDLAKLLPSQSDTTVRRVIDNSTIDGPVVLFQDPRNDVKTNVIVNGGSPNTNPIMHEIGHIIDNKRNPILNRISETAKDLSYSDALKMGLGALAMSKKVGAAAPIAAAAMYAPVLRSEMAANANAASIIRHIKGDDAARKYIREQTPDFNTYVKPAIATTATLGGLHLLARNKDKLLGLAKKVIRA